MWRDSWRESDVSYENRFEPVEKRRERSEWGEQRKHVQARSEGAVINRLFSCELPLS